MKKSEKYYLAMLAIVDSNLMAGQKLEILEMLAGEKSLAEFVEKAQEEEKNG